MAYGTLAHTVGTLPLHISIEGITEHEINASIQYLRSLEVAS